MGRKPIKFPSKGDYNFRKPDCNWWENGHGESKKADRQQAKKEIREIRRNNVSV